MMPMLATHSELPTVRMDLIVSDCCVVVHWSRAAETIMRPHDLSTAFRHGR
ncbi:hypothetical protein JI435_302830 [Parastagonospora nodorum SN15]|uniref:Uncharacterized protein n=1 Tax=Phaeosphaeria nodorum (strain SN15 / ATCC MYA-4574 / FGSC 10173) TaxID=321614 RepID=A0A7U2EZ58_PHANO|nr:hypothetical protein JI435_302830 [Parastagonospora nodorum SN15]